MAPTTIQGPSVTSSERESVIHELQNVQALLSSIHRLAENDPVLSRMASMAEEKLTECINDIETEWG